MSWGNPDGYEDLESFLAYEADSIIAAAGDIEPPSLQSAEAILAANAPKQKHFYWPNVLRDIESSLGSRLSLAQEDHLYDVFEQILARGGPQQHSSEWARRVIAAANLSTAPQGRGGL